VSIGLPVFNGEEYIAKTLNSILAQTFVDFEVIISDNASTDNTEQICRGFMERDGRIRYYRNKRNLGVSRNSNIAFELSRGKYFKWASHDDLLAPEFLEECVRILDQDHSVVLCHCKAAKIYENGHLVRTQEVDRSPNIDSWKTHKRFGDLISFGSDMAILFGVVRADILKKTPLMGPYIGSDRNLAGEISLYGRIYRVPKYLFYERYHPHGYSSQQWESYQKQMNWWDPTRKAKLKFIYNCLEYFRSVNRVPLDSTQRMLCYVQIIKWIMRQGWFMIAADLAGLVLPSLGLRCKSTFYQLPFLNRIRGLIGAI
jgi:glycosyltransferase involved in cell wall biosynthesis